MQHVRDCGPMTFIISRKGGTLLAINGFVYRSNQKRFGKNGDKVYWECIHNRSRKCRSRLKTIADDLYVTNDVHNHSDDGQRIENAKRNGSHLLKTRSSNSVRRRRSGKKKKQPIYARLEEIVSSHSGTPYSSCTIAKGRMQVMYEGHYFRYLFRRGPYTIFQCYYQENNIQCQVKIVSDQKRLYPVEGEHFHTVKAVAKTATGLTLPTTDKIPDLDADPYKVQIVPVDNGQEYFEIRTCVTEESNNQPQCVDDDDESIFVPNYPPKPALSSTELREQIKLRLQKALNFKEKN